MFGGRKNNGNDEGDENLEDDVGQEEQKDDGMNLPGLGSVKRSSDDQEVDVAEELKHMDLDSANELEKILKENPEVIEKYNMTWSVQQVQGFLPNINPSYIRARTEKAKTEAMQEANGSKITGDVVLLIVILGFSAAIIYAIVSQTGGSGGGGGGPAQDVAQGSGAAISLLGASLRQKYSTWRDE